MSEKNRSTIYFLTLCLLASCTSNPFLDDEQIETGKITGEIHLSNGTNPGDMIFVWLNGFEVGTFTKQDGTFQLNLPPETGQGENNGYSGVYPLYFYCENCRLDSIEITFINGMVAEGQRVIESNGALTNRVILDQLFTLETYITTDNTIRSYFTSESDVRIYCKKLIIGHAPHYSGLFLYNRDLSIVMPYVINGFPTQQEAISPEQPLEMSMINPYDPADLSPGEYYITPYVITSRPQNLPESIIENFSPEAWGFNEKYLHLPFIREESTIIIE